MLVMLVMLVDYTVGGTVQRWPRSAALLASGGTRQPLGPAALRAEHPHHAEAGEVNDAKPPPGAPAGAGS